MNIFVLTSLAVATLHAAVSPVFAGGFIYRPRSRQVICAEENVRGCGDVRNDPKSVEAPDGSFSCNGGGARFKELNNEHVWGDYFSIVPHGFDRLPFTWTITSAHRTMTFDYHVFPYVQESGFQEGYPILLATFHYINQTMPSLVTHDVPFPNYKGRLTILGRWSNEGTSNATYSCVDLGIRRGGNYSSPIAVPDYTIVKDRRKGIMVESNPGQCRRHLPISSV